MNRSAIILPFNEAGQDRGLMEVNGKPFIKTAVSNVCEYVDEVVIVVSSQEQADAYAKHVPAIARFVVDPQELQKPAAAALAGFEAALGDYCLLTSLATPLIQKDIALLLFECGIGKSATIPRTPDCESNPLQAVYQKSIAIEELKRALDEGISNLAVMVDGMRGVRFMSTMIFEQITPPVASKSKPQKSKGASKKKTKPKKR
ncbi:MAG: NTP transferase domain-containing protein [Candidatus Bathyarchaeota archaeon]|nr:NTP transferase domain-containing protein [Candidatus Bathyarchaeota archaeon]